MTDRLTPQTEAAILRLVADVIDRAFVPMQEGSAARYLISPFRDEAARREAEGPTVRADGWRSDCPKCVASKFACDEHRKPDAPPPPAPIQYTYGYGVVREDGTFKGFIDRDGYEGTSIYGPGERRVRAAIVPEEDAKAIEALRDDAKRLREASKKAVGVLARAFDRIHCLPRTSDTELANDISATMTALAQGGNDG